MALADELRHRRAALGDTVVAAGEEKQRVGLIVVDLRGHRLGMLAVMQADHHERAGLQLLDELRCDFLRGILVGHRHSPIGLDCH